MKATDFDLSKHLVLDPRTGTAVFFDNRMLIFAADAIGLLRQNIVEEFGWERARDVILRFGYQNGFSDYLQLKVNYDFDSEEDLLAAGPVIHSWEGIVQASPKDITFDWDKDEMYFSGVWSNSYEADQYLSFNHYAQEPVCWSLVGYASGYATAFFGRPIVAIEPICRGRGDSNCEWLLQRPNAFGAEAHANIAALEKFWSEPDGR
jgi:hypothetical protein